MTDKKLLEKIEEYLENNKQSESIDVQIDSEHLLFWIKKWRNDENND